MGAITSLLLSDVVLQNTEILLYPEILDSSRETDGIMDIETSRFVYETLLI